MTNCERCGKRGLTTIMSTFNTDLICLECKEKEKHHPSYQEACDAEQTAVITTSQESGNQTTYRTHPKYEGGFNHG